MRPSIDCATRTVAALPFEGLARLAGISVAAIVAATTLISPIFSFMRVPFVWAWLSAEGDVQRAPPGKRRWWCETWLLLAWLTSVFAEDPARPARIPASDWGRRCGRRWLERRGVHAEAASATPIRC